jgi:hypothetical protein
MIFGPSHRVHAVRFLIRIGWLVPGYPIARKTRKAQYRMDPGQSWTLKAVDKKSTSDPLISDRSSWSALSDGKGPESEFDASWLSCSPHLSLPLTQGYFSVGSSSLPPSIRSVQNYLSPSQPTSSLPVDSIDFPVKTVSKRQGCTPIAQLHDHSCDWVCAAIQLIRMDTQHLIDHRHPGRYVLRS